MKRTSLVPLVASFFISIFLFYYISGEESVEIQKRAYLRVMPPKGMTVVGGPTREIVVTLDAPRNALSVLGTQKIVAYHKIHDVKASGEYSFSLRDIDIKIAQPGVRVTAIQPNVITVSLDELITKKMTIKPLIVGDPGDGFVVDSDALVADPNAALVQGPKSKLETKKVILTDAIDVVGRVRSFRVRVPLKYSSQYSVVSNELIDVYVPIKQQGVERVLEAIPVNVLTGANKQLLVTAQPATVSVTVSGPEGQIAALTAKDVTAYVNVAELPRGTYQLPLKMTVPPGISVQGEVPVISVNVEDTGKVLSGVAQLATLTPGKKE